MVPHLRISTLVWNGEAPTSTGIFFHCGTEEEKGHPGPAGLWQLTPSIMDLSFLPAHQGRKGHPGPAGLWQLDPIIIHSA